MKRTAFIALLVIAVAGIARAQEQFPNWRSCSLDFWENAKDFSDLRDGVPVAKLGKNADVINDALKESAFTAATEIHRAYTKCLESFTNGKIIRPGPPNDEFWRCAYASATYLAILLKLDRGQDAQTIKGALPSNLHGTISVLVQHFALSRDRAAAETVATSKECVAEAAKRTTD